MQRPEAELGPEAGSPPPSSPYSEEPEEKGQEVGQGRWV